MSNKNLSLILMALVAMSCFSPSLSLAQANKPFSSKIKTPNTSKELAKEEKSSPKNEAVAEKEAVEESSPSSAPAERKLQQHGLGLGIGQTFLMGNYGKYGEDKITGDLLYSYAASHSFDLLVGAHNSTHKDNRDRMRVRAITASIKGRVVEFDNFSPYFLGGLGFYAPQAYRRVSTSYKWTDPKITFGLNFGAGADLRLNDHYVVGVMAQLHWPFNMSQDEGADLKGYYTKLLLTGMYLF